MFAMTVWQAAVCHDVQLVPSPCLHSLLLLLLVLLVTILLSCKPNISCTPSPAAAWFLLNRHMKSMRQAFAGDMQVSSAWS